MSFFDDIELRGIVTNKPDAFTRPLLAALGVSRARSGCVVSGDRLPQRKPRPCPADARGDGARRAGEPLRLRRRRAARHRGRSRRRHGDVAAAYGYIRPREDIAAWGADAFMRRPDGSRRTCSRRSTERRHDERRRAADRAAGRRRRRCGIGLASARARASRVRDASSPSRTPSCGNRAALEVERERVARARGAAARGAVFGQFANRRIPEPLRDVPQARARELERAERAREGRARGARASDRRARAADPRGARCAPSAAAGARQVAARDSRQHHARSSRRSRRASKRSAPRRATSSARCAAPRCAGNGARSRCTRLVELAGMVEHCDFVMQSHLATESGAVRPDMVVHLPEGRDLVVDVKTPLDAYLEATEASDRRRAARRARAPREHRRAAGFASSRRRRIGASSRRARSS